MIEDRGIGERGRGRHRVAPPERRVRGRFPGTMTRRLRVHRRRREPGLAGVLGQEVLRVCEPKSGSQSFGRLWSLCFRCPSSAPVVRKNAAPISKS